MFYNFIRGFESLLVAVLVLHVDLTLFRSLCVEQGRLAQLMQIQSQMDGSVSIVSCKRELIKQGKIFTVSARTAKPTERYAFLVSVRACRLTFSKNALVKKKEESRSTCCMLLGSFALKYL